MHKYQAQVTNSPVIYTCAALLLILGECTGLSNEEVSRSSTRFTFANKPIAAAGLFTIGDLDSGFYGRVDLAVDAHGTLYVTDAGYRAIRKYSPEGQPMGQIGRKGEGPGEFRRPPGLTIGPDDTLYAWDLGTRRLSVFTPGENGFEYSVPLRSSGSAVPIEVFKPDTAGLLFEYQPFAGGQRSSYDSINIHVSWVNRESHIRRDSLVVAPADQHHIARWKGGERHMKAPFGRQSIVRIGPRNHIFYGWSDSLVIEIYDLEGELQEALELPSARYH